MTSTDIERIVEDVRQAASEFEALVLETVLSFDELHIPAARVLGSEFPALIGHCKPKLVYLFAEPFDAAAELETSLDEEDLDENPSAKKLIAAWRHRNGQACRVVLGMMHDGVLHTVVEEVEWRADFESQVEVLANELRQMSEDAEHRLHTENQKTIVAKAKRLMADSRFNAPRISIAKRTALAEILFPDLDKSTIRAVVERADMDHWLATTGKE